MKKTRLTKENFNQVVILDTGLVLVVFRADWSSSCQIIDPILEEFYNETSEDIVIAEVDVDEHPSLGHRFDVDALPTVILFRNGEEENRFHGIKSKDFLDTMLKIEG